MRRRFTTRSRVSAGAAIGAALLAMLFTSTEIDVPSWANIPGVDLPFVGDDPLVCDVALSTDGIVAELSGGGGEIDDYRYVWLNGDVVDAVGPTEHRFVVARPDAGDAHIAVSTTTESSTRFWCGTISGSAQ